LARTEFDHGAVAPSHLMERMVLALAPDPGQQVELDEPVAAQHDPASPLYQHWITPDE